MRKTVAFETGAAIDVDREPDAPLLEILRAAGRKSVVRGCATGTCGACRVLVNGELRASCMLVLRDLPERATITTLEDVATEPFVAGALAAFEEERPTRCRLCIGGLGVAACHLERSGDKTREGIDAVLEGATCMCTGRSSLRRSLVRAAGG